MRRICTFIPAHTNHRRARAWDDRQRSPADTAQPHGARSARAAAVSKQIIVRAAAEPATARMDSPLAPSA